MLNPKVDKLIEKAKQKFSMKHLKRFTIVVAIFMILNTAFSTLAVNAFSARTVIENELPAKNKDFYEIMYKYFYNDKMKNISQFFWNEEIMIKVYPNLRIILEDDSVIYVQDYYKYVQPYYFKLKK